MKLLTTTLAALLVALGSQSSSRGQTTAFTYQGYLTSGGAPANGAFDFQFALFPDSVNTNNQVDTTMSVNALGVTNGLFTTELIFPVAGADFNGSDRWLQIWVRPSLVGTNYVALTPRQRLTSTPYAIRAARATTADALPGINYNPTNSSTAFGLNTTASGNTSTAMGYQTSASGASATAMGQNTVASGDSATAMGSATTASGTYATAMGYLTKASGFAATAAGAFGWATNDYSLVWADGSSPVPFTSISNNQFLVRATGGVGINTNNPNGAALAVNGDLTVNGNFKGGYSGNVISNGVVGAFIGGGGNSSFQNVVGKDFASVLGGARNRALETYSTAMGFENTASGFASVAMGWGNAASDYGATAMGSATTASGQYATAMGAFTTASGPYSVAMGNQSAASGFAALAMGLGANAFGPDSVAMGTSALATNLGAISIGKAVTSGGLFSTAMGSYAGALHDGAFVWSDLSTTTPFNSTGNNQFLLRATGGVGINTNNPNGAALAVNGDMTVTGNFKGGSPANIISNGVVGGFIGGGGTSGIFANRVGASYASVVGGYGNTASGTASTAMGNGAVATGVASTSAGYGTTANGLASTALGLHATASGDVSTAMGQSTTASGNTATAMGYYTAASGAASVAMGAYARATNDNTFVWADGSSTTLFDSTGVNQFIIRATGGVAINTNDPGGATLNVNGFIRAGHPFTEGFEVVGPAAGYALLDRTTGAAGRWSMYANNGLLRFYTGGGDRMTLSTSALTVNGTFVSASDRNLKENFTPVDAQEVLNKVAALPITRWNYKQDATTPHLGPMAQDFYAAFNVGPDDKHITTVDESGVALAAIQGLNQKLEQKEAEITELKSRLESLERLILNQK